MKGGSEEFSLIKQSIAESRGVETGELDTIHRIDILLKDAESQHGHRCVEQIIDWYKHGIKQCLCWGKKEKKNKS